MNPAYNAPITPPGSPQTKARQCQLGYPLTPQTSPVLIRQRPSVLRTKSKPYYANASQDGRHDEHSPLGSCHGRPRSHTAKAHKQWNDNYEEFWEKPLVPPVVVEDTPCGSPIQHSVSNAASFETTSASVNIPLSPLSSRRVFDIKDPGSAHSGFAMTSPGEGGHTRELVVPKSPPARKGLGIRRISESLRTMTTSMRDSLSSAKPSQVVSVNSSFRIDNL